MDWLLQFLELLAPVPPPPAWPGFKETLFTFIKRLFGTRCFIHIILFHPYLCEGGFNLLRKRTAREIKRLFQASETYLKAPSFGNPPLAPLGEPVPLFSCPPTYVAYVSIICRQLSAHTSTPLLDCENSLLQPSTCLVHNE